MTFVGQGLWEGASLSAAGDTTLRSFPGDSHFLPLSPGKSWEIRNCCLQSPNCKHTRAGSAAPRSASTPKDTPRRRRPWRARLRARGAASRPSSRAPGARAPSTPTSPLQGTARGVDPAGTEPGCPFRQLISACGWVGSWKSETGESLSGWGGGTELD